MTASGSMDSMSTYLAGSGVSLKVYGDDMEDLQSSAKALAAALKTVEGTGEVSDGLEEATTALHISVDRNAAMEKGRHRGAGVYGGGLCPDQHLHRLRPDAGWTGDGGFRPVPRGEPHDP